MIVLFILIMIISFIVAKLYCFKRKNKRTKSGYYWKNRLERSKYIYSKL